MKYFILLLIVLLTLSGCMTQKKRSDVFHRYAREHKEEVLEYCPPVKTEVKEGKTDTIKVTDTSYIKVPYAVPGTTDTILVDCPETEVMRVYINKTDTLFQENTAALEAALLRENNTEDKLVAAESERDIYRKQARNRLWLFIAGIASTAVVLILRIRGLF